MSTVTYDFIVVDVMILSAYIYVQQFKKIKGFF